MSSLSPDQLSDAVDLMQIQEENLIVNPDQERAALYTELHDHLQAELIEPTGELAQDSKRFSRDAQEIREQVYKKTQELLSFILQTCGVIDTFNSDEERWQAFCQIFDLTAARPFAQDLTTLAEWKKSIFTGGYTNSNNPLYNPATIIQLQQKIIELDQELAQNYLATSVGTVAERSNDNTKDLLTADEAKIIEYFAFWLRFNPRGKIVYSVLTEKKPLQDELLLQVQKEYLHGFFKIDPKLGDERSQKANNATKLAISHEREVAEITDLFFSTNPLLIMTVLGHDIFKYSAKEDGTPIFELAIHEDTSAAFHAKLLNKVAAYLTKKYTLDDVFPHETLPKISEILPMALEKVLKKILVVHGDDEFPATTAQQDPLYTKDYLQKLGVSVSMSEDGKIEPPPTPITIKHEDLKKTPPQLGRLFGSLHFRPQSALEIIFTEPNVADKTFRSMALILNVMDRLVGAGSFIKYNETYPTEFLKNTRFERYIDRSILKSFVSCLPKDRLERLKLSQKPFIQELRMRGSLLFLLRDKGTFDKIVIAAQKESSEQLRDKLHYLYLTMETVRNAYELLKVPSEKTTQAEIKKELAQKRDFFNACFNHLVQELEKFSCIEFADEPFQIFEGATTFGETLLYGWEQLVDANQ